MKKNMIAAAATIAAALGAWQLSAAVDATWIGGTSGTWSDGSNWSGGTAPNGKDDIARITKSEPVAITATASVKLAELHSSGANHSLTSSSGSVLYMSTSAASKEGVIDVADGTLFTCAISVRSDGNLAQSFIKTGGGELKVTVNGIGSGNPFDGIDVRGGVLNMAWSDHTDGCKPNKKIHVATNAVLRANCMNCIENDVVIDIDEGGVFDQNNKGDLIGGFTGRGLATNLYCNVTLGGGPHRFDGILAGTLMPKATASGLGVDTEDHTRFIIGSRDTAANAVINSDYSDNADRINPILFGDGAGGVFYIKNCGWRRESPLVLEDVAGNPVTVLIAGDISGRPMRGKGSYCKNHVATYYVTNDLVSIGGRISTISPPSGNNYINVGNHRPSQDAVVAGIEGFDVPRGAILVYRNATNDNWGTTEIAGEGSLFIYSTNSWTVPLSIGGTTGDIWWGANGTGDGSTLTISGGRCTAWLNMNDVTNVTLRITGGDHNFRGRTKASRNRRFEQTGGIARFNPISAFDYDYTDNPIFYRMTGGEFHSTTETTYSRGLGMDISGDSKVYLHTGSGSYGYHRLSSDGESHAIVLRDNALLEVEGLAFAAGGSTEGYNASFRLLGGTFRTHSHVSTLNTGMSDYSLYPHFTGEFVFDGGWVETTRAMNWLLSPCYTAGSSTTGYVGRAGMKWRTVHPKLTDVAYFKAPIVSGVGAGETDGGILKKGRGALCLHEDSSYNGPTRVLGGLLKSGNNVASGGTTTPFGTGDVEVDSSVLALSSTSASQTLASAPGAKFTYGGGSALTFWGPASSAVAVGPAGAAEGASFVRRGHGVLTIGCREIASGVIGTTHKVFANGGMPSDPNTGLVAAPIFGAFSEGNSGWWYIQPLVYDAQDGFKVASFTEGLDGGANSIARISSAAITLMENKHVGALDLRYKNGNSAAGGLTIASGVTLTVGNGAGTFAPIFFNNHQLNNSAPSQTLKGGTVDFGAAEGVLLFNINYYYGWWRPAQITSAFAGSGGVTFAGIAETINYRCEVEISGDSTYTGGTWIENVTVKPLKNGVFSSGTITVVGGDVSGGGIWVWPDSAMTKIDNDLVISGVGRYAQTDGYVTGYQECDYGALRTDRTLALNGTVTLAGDALVRAVGISTVATYAGGVFGEGNLTVAGSGTTKFTHVNTYRGRTIVEGVLEIAQGGTLGDGAVEVAEGGLLRFANTSPMTVTNVVTGAGRIVLAGAPVTFTAAAAFTGEIVNMGQAATGDDLVKEGGDTLYLAESQTHTGATRVLDGTLALGRAASDSVPFADDIVVRLDATDRSTFTFNSEVSPTNISDWADADGRSLVYSNSTESEQPFLNEGAINGHDAVFIHGNRCRLATTTKVSPRAVFAVTRMSNTTHPIGWTCAGFFGINGVDNGIRCDNSSDRNWQNDNWLKFGDVRQNGVFGRKWSWNVATVDSFVMGGVELNSIATAIGDYWHHSTYKRCIRGDVGEVIVYGRTLEADETAAVEAYLSKKWDIAITDAWTSAPENVLPVGTDVFVDEGAVLDLCGATQTVRTVSGTGLVTNSAPTRALLCVTEDTAMTWDFGGDIALYVADGAELDLCGKTVTVAEAGGSGRIVNGTLVVTGEIQPGGVGGVGELAFASAPVFDGATLVIDGDGRGGCDRIVVEAPFSLAGLSLRVSDFSRIGAYISTIATAQALDGAFDSDNIVNRKSWKVRYSATSAELLHLSGSVLLFR
jgi:autotransporter-associated beta strand protein